MYTLYFYYLIVTICVILKMKEQITNAKGTEILKKLENVKTMKQIQSIYDIARSQNSKLIKQIKLLKQKVEIITSQRSQTFSDAHNQNRNKQLQISKIKKQLKNKYSKMKCLKQEIDKCNSKNIDEGSNQKSQKKNLLAITQKNIQQLRKQLEDLKKNYAKLQATQQQAKKQNSLNKPKIDQIQQQNKRLKQNISKIRKKEYQSQYESIKIQTSLIDNKIKIRLINKIGIDNFQTLSINQRLQENQQLKNLKSEITSLRLQKQNVEQSCLKNQNEQKRKRQILFENNKEVLKNLRDLELQKCKIEHQNNKWKTKWNNISRAIQLHSKKVKNISVQTQTLQYLDTAPLRRDYAGILSKHRFDDRNILQDEKTTKIIGMLIYQTQKGLVSLEAHYNNGKKSQMLVPQHFIQRCRVTKIQCSENDFFKLFKVKYNSMDNKITKIEIRSNKNIRYQYGQKKQWSDLVEGDSIYGFDIGIKQCPVSIFGSYNLQKGYWLLEGFGVQINDLASYS